MLSGTLYLAANGRWQILRPAHHPTTELTAGDVIEVHIAGHWIATRIEYSHSARAYYAVTDGVQLANHLRARLIDQEHHS